jgi:hypothetical protein
MVMELHPMGVRKMPVRHTKAFFRVEGAFMTVNMDRAGGERERRIKCASGDGQ